MQVRTYLWLAAGLTLSIAPGLKAQATATATAGVHFSGFGGVTGVFTGLGLAKNLSITAGLDATLRPVFGLYPSLEVRGTYPVDSGMTIGERNVLVGLNVARHLGVLQPYGDVLVGRGQINYIKPYADPTGTMLYIQTASSVYALGAGTNILFSPHFGFKGDFQFEKYATPVDPSGAIYSKAFTAGVVYQIGLGGIRRGRHW